MCIEMRWYLLFIAVRRLHLKRKKGRLNSKGKKENNACGKVGQGNSCPFNNYWGKKRTRQDEPMIRIITIQNSHFIMI